MNNIKLVIAAAVKNNIRLRSVIVVATGAVLICILGIAVLFVTQFIIPEVNKSIPDRLVIYNYLGLTLFTTSFLCMGVYANVFAFQSLTREKSRGNIQALLATPLTPGDIWIGKSLAVFLPGLVFAEVMTFAVLLVINFVFLTPYIGFAATPYMVISNFIAVPLIYLALNLLVHIVGLTAKPAIGNVIFQIFLPVMTTLMINLAVRDVPNASSWLFTVILLGVAVVIGVIVFMIRSKLTVERIMLSQ
ncbi:MAG: ABC transporter permease subunit [Dehalococcoidales bacterium]|nr:ABC transporter permease subunit [Dehalococcoidales bacterium]